MTTGIISEKSPDNETIWIPTPISTHDISPMNVLVMQQEKVHFQALAQGNERKEKISTRAIDEITLRIYFPRTPEITLVIIPGVFATSMTETTAATNQFASTLSNQGPPLLLYTSAPA